MSSRGIVPEGEMRQKAGLRRACAALVAAIVIAVMGNPMPAWARSHQQTFEALEPAVQALVDAVRKNDTKAVVAILGPEGRALVSSGDPVLDRQHRESFLKSYDAAHRLEGGGGKVVLYTGPEDFPMPIPLVPDGPVWRWDTGAGREEILNRRIGRNELATIQVCLAYVDAQREYYAEPRGKDGVLQYAQRVSSSPGKRDGLYWDTKQGEKPSPLGPLIARARTEGYAGKPDSGFAAYHGYLYRILTAQGPDAPDGALDYVAGGRMIGGFALVAFPAQYGVSGVMTFIVNHDGVVYEKDLGPQTGASARQMKRFNPDQTWKKAPPSS